MRRGGERHEAVGSNRVSQNSESRRMESHLALITDAPRRGECPVRALSAVDACRMHDLDQAIASIWRIYAALNDRQPYRPLMPARALAILSDMAGPIAGSLGGAYCPVAAAIDA